jgi:hypothetical protein
MTSSMRLLWMLGIIPFCFGAFAATPNAAIPVPPAAQHSARSSKDVKGNASWVTHQVSITAHGAGPSKLLV